MPNPFRQWLSLCASRPAVLAIAALVCALAAGPGNAQATSEGPASQIVVTGEGRVAQAPDMATITLGAVHEAETAAEALAATSDATARIVEGLAEAGIEARDIRTENLSLSPRVDYGRDGSAPQVTGYVASNAVQVRVRDLSALGARLDAAVAAGGNRFDGLAFGLQNPGPSEDEARTRAVQDALRKARIYAEAAGLQLGPVLSIVEQGVFDGPQPMFRTDAAVAAAPVPVAPGEVSTVVRVTVTLGLSPL